jgi:hypothetical protein
MGTGVSSYNVDTFKTLKEAYENGKVNEIDDASILQQMQTIILSKHKEEDPSERKKRNQDWLCACGKYEKGGKGPSLDRAQQLYSEGIDIDFVDEDGCSALAHACGEGQLKICRFLVEECIPGPNIDLQAVDNCTPLWTACFNGHTDVVHFLLLVGADERFKGEPEGVPVSSPALAARRNGQPGIADLLDLEAELRTNDPTRRERLKNREMTNEEYKASLRGGLTMQIAPG